jgi:hypothetical protein
MESLPLAIKCTHKITGNILYFDSIQAFGKYVCAKPSAIRRVLNRPGSCCSYTVTSLYVATDVVADDTRDMAT